jgi:hypothetical protein
MLSSYHNAASGKIQNFAFSYLVFKKIFEILPMQLILNMEAQGLNIHIP